MSNRNGERACRVREMDEPRNREGLHRRRRQFDKSMRTSHSVNCSGFCAEDR